MSEKILCNKEDLVAIADATRSATGSTATYNVSELSVLAVDMINSGGGSPYAVLYTEQTLTDEQKTQARENIGAGTPVTVDNTLTVSGTAADAKAVGDALAEKQPVGNYVLESNLGALATKDVVVKSDLESSVQTSLDKADTALQFYAETDPTVPAWAKEPTKPTYIAEEIGLGNVDNTSDIDKPISIAMQTALDELRAELSRSIIGDEWKLVNEASDTIFSVDASGVYATSLILNGQDIKNIIDGKISASIVNKLDSSDLPDAINDALGQAKESGEFDGYSPVRGTDYWTDADKAEIKNYVDEAILGGAW